MSFSKLLRALLSSSPAAAACLLLLLSAPSARAGQSASRIFSRPGLAARHRQVIAERLREITGWRDLRFDESGALVHGGAYAGGSPTARELLDSAASGRDVLVIEDASGRDDVVFCRVVPARWTGDAQTRPPAHIILVDMADFSHVTGDRDALAAFNVGWGLLHEISHVVNDSKDADCEGEVGECEAVVNRMRRECSLAERAEYHFRLIPGFERGGFKTRLVRLAFVRRDSSNRERRLWLMWDASLVGGLRKGKAEG